MDRKREDDTDDGECYSGNIRNNLFPFIFNFEKWKEAITTVKKMLQERCGNRIVVSKQGIHELQHQQLLLGDGNEEISNIWKELCDRCPSVDNPSSASTTKTSMEQFVFNETLKDNTTPTYNLCVAYAPNGSSIAQ